MQITLLTENQKNRTLEEKFDRAVTVCEAFGLNVNLVIYTYTLKHKGHAENKM
jgi:hypothetical protein